MIGANAGVAGGRFQETSVAPGAEHRLVDVGLDEPVGWVGRADVGVVAVGLNLEEPRQGIERGCQQDRQDEAACPDAILQPEERLAEHDVP